MLRHLRRMAAVGPGEAGLRSRLRFPRQVWQHWVSGNTAEFVVALLGWMRRGSG